jgi:hypothetical protein
MLAADARSRDVGAGAREGVGVDVPLSGWAGAELASGEPPLDLHEGITDPTAWACSRWPANLRLRSTLDQLVPGRCKATNLCDYCAKLAAIENSEVLALDAMEGDAPRVWLVLTTPSTNPDPAVFCRSRDQLVKSLRRRFPGLEWAALVEFTTGYGTRSDGKRRPHWNLLLKGVGREDIEVVRDVTETVWCPRVGGVIEAQHIGTVDEYGGLMRYIALHFQKESQKPPRGWRGHRFLHSRGYLWTDTAAAREAARQALRLKRELRKAGQSGLTGEAALEAAHLALYEANELGWELVRLQELPTSFGVDGLPVSYDVVAVPVR